MLIRILFGVVLFWSSAVFAGGGEDPPPPPPPGGNVKPVERMTTQLRSITAGGIDRLSEVVVLVVAGYLSFRCVRLFIRQVGIMAMDARIDRFHRAAAHSERLEQARQDAQLRELRAKPWAWYGYDSAGTRGGRRRS